MQNTIHNINYLYCVTIFKLIITISIVNVHQLFYIATGIAMARPQAGPAPGRASAESLQMPRPGSADWQAVPVSGRL